MTAPADLPRRRVVNARIKPARLDVAVGIDHSYGELEAHALRDAGRGGDAEPGRRHGIVVGAMPDFNVPLALRLGICITFDCTGPVNVMTRNSAIRPSDMIVLTRPLDQNTPRPPCDANMDCRKASSALSPSTIASTSGASG